MGRFIRTVMAGILLMAMATMLVPNPVSAAALIISNITEHVNGTTATISWRTSREANTWVDYGTSAATRRANSEGRQEWATYHTVKIYNLQPGVRYYYQIRSRAADNTLGTADGDFAVNFPLSVTADVSPRTVTLGQPVTITGSVNNPDEISSIKVTDSNRVQLGQTIPKTGGSTTWTPTSTGTHTLYVGAYDWLGIRVKYTTVTVTVNAPAPVALVVTGSVSSRSITLGESVVIQGSVNDPGQIASIKVTTSKDVQVGQTIPRTGGSTVVSPDTAGTHIYRVGAYNASGTRLKYDAVSVVVKKPTYTVTATASPTTVKVGETVTFKATASPTAGLTYLKVFDSATGQQLGKAGEQLALVNGTTTWKPQKEGTYKVWVWAYSTDLKQEVKGEVTVTVTKATTPPTLVVTGKATPKTITLGESVVIEGSVNDPSQIASIKVTTSKDVQVGQTIARTGGSTVVTPDSAGTHIYRVGAYNASGTRLKYDAVSVVVKKPTYTVTATATPTTVKVGETVTFKATANPTEGLKYLKVFDSATGQQLGKDGEQLALVNGTTTWKPQKEGTYKVWVWAYNTDLKQEVKGEVTVTVAKPKAVKPERVEAQFLEGSSEVYVAAFFPAKTYAKGVSPAPTKVLVKNAAGGTLVDQRLTQLANAPDSFEAYLSIPAKNLMEAKNLTVAFQVDGVSDTVLVMHGGLLKAAASRADAVKKLNAQDLTIDGVKALAIQLSTADQLEQAARNKGPASSLFPIQKVDAATPLYNAMLAQEHRFWTAQAATWTPASDAALQGLIQTGPLSAAQRSNLVKLHGAYVTYLSNARERWHSILRWQPSNVTKHGKEMDKAVQDAASVGGMRTETIRTGLVTRYQVPLDLLYNQALSAGTSNAEMRKLVGMYNWAVQKNDWQNLAKAPNSTGSMNAADYAKYLLGYGATAKNAPPEQGSKNLDRWPITTTALKGSLISDFGMRKHDGGSKYHPGLDLIADRGTAVNAPAAGRVTFVGCGESSRTVGIHHQALGYTTFFVHLEKILVTDGQEVKSGQQIATSGPPEGVTQFKPHLHMGIWRGDYTFSVCPVAYDELPDQNINRWDNPLKYLPAVSGETPPVINWLQYRPGESGSYVSPGTQQVVTKPFWVSTEVKAEDRDLEGARVVIRDSSGKEIRQVHEFKYYEGTTAYNPTMPVGSGSSYYASPGDPELATWDKFYVRVDSALIPDDAKFYTVEFQVWDVYGHRTSRSITVTRKAVAAQPTVSRVQVKYQEATNKLYVAAWLNTSLATGGSYPKSKVTLYSGSTALKTVNLEHSASADSNAFDGYITLTSDVPISKDLTVYVEVVGHDPSSLAQGNAKNQAKLSGTLLDILRKRSQNTLSLDSKSLTEAYIVKYYSAVTEADAQEKALRAGNSGLLPETMRGDPEGLAVNATLARVEAVWLERATGKDTQAVADLDYYLTKNAKAPSQAKQKGLALRNAYDQYVRFSEERYEAILGRNKTQADGNQQTVEQALKTAASVGGISQAVKDRVAARFQPAINAMYLQAEKAAKSNAAGDKEVLQDMVAAVTAKDWSHIEKPPVSKNRPAVDARSIADFLKPFVTVSAAPKNWGELSKTYFPTEQEQQILWTVAGAENSLKSPNRVWGRVNGDSSRLNFGFISLQVPTGGGHQALLSMFKDQSEKAVFIELCLQNLTERKAEVIPEKYSSMLQVKTDLTIAKMTPREMASKFINLMSVESFASEAAKKAWQNEVADWIFKYMVWDSTQSDPTGKNGNVIRHQWDKVFGEFLSRDKNIAIQFSVIRSTYYDPAIKIAKGKLGFTTVRGMAFTFDTMVQTGSDLGYYLGQALKNQKFKELWSQDTTDLARMQLIRDHMFTPSDQYVKLPKAIPYFDVIWFRDTDRLKRGSAIIVSKDLTDETYGPK